MNDEQDVTMSCHDHVRIYDTRDRQLKPIHEIHGPNSVSAAITWVGAQDNRQYFTIFKKHIMGNRTLWLPLKQPYQKHINAHMWALPVFST